LNTYRKVGSGARCGNFGQKSRPWASNTAMKAGNFDCVLVSYDCSALKSVDFIAKAREKIDEIESPVQEGISYQRRRYHTWLWKTGTDRYRCGLTKEAFNYYSKPTMASAESIRLCV
jgi:hypothetical protein